MRSYAQGWLEAVGSSLDSLPEAGDAENWSELFSSVEPIDIRGHPNSYQIVVSRFGVVLQQVTWTLSTISLLARALGNQPRSCL
jgi:hypothetical protein